MNSSYSRRFILILAALSPVYATSSGFAATTPQQERLTLSRDAAQDTVTLIWFAKDGATYQLQKSTDLTLWVNEGPPVPGSNAFAMATFSTLDVPQAFFRLKPDVITAFFSGGVLTVNGGDMDNEIILSRDAEGRLLVNGGLVDIEGGDPTILNTIRIDIFGRGGDDRLMLDESLGALPPVRLFGEAGDDFLSAGSGSDLLDGGTGNDTLLGMGGADALLGGDGDDSLTGGDGEDSVSGDNHDDRLIWNAGDDTDLNEGGQGIDTIEVNGDDAGEFFTVTANGTRVRLDKLAPEPSFLDIGTAEKLHLSTQGGNDSFAATGNLAALIQLTVDGGAGEDSLLGSNGADTLLGGADKDFIDGNQGGDVVLLGEGDDVFQWDPGDGSDTVEGQHGKDTLRFNGSAGSELFIVSANGARISFVRNLASIAMDLNEIETLDLNALGGADTLTVNSLSGTGMSEVIADLAAAGGGGAADGAMDNVVLRAGDANDVITAEFANGTLAVHGFDAQVKVKGYDIGSDAVRMMAGQGEDIIDVSAVQTGGPRLVLVGNEGGDILLGSVDADTLDGGEQEDLLIGGGGLDLLDGGLEEGDILIQDGLSHVTGIVTLFGDGMDNTITISRNEAGEILSNGVPIEGATVENTSLIRVFGRDGDDAITLVEANGPLPPAVLYGGAGIDTLGGTASADMLFGGGGNDTLLGNGGADQLYGGAGDDALTGGADNDKIYGGADADRMIWNPGDNTDLNEGGTGVDTTEVTGTDGADIFTPAENGTRVYFDGIAPTYFALDIGGTEHLAVNCGDGRDEFLAVGNLAGLIELNVDGGSGNDTLSGSDGEDTFHGGDGQDIIDAKSGADTIYAGNGNDLIKWGFNAGFDVIEGGEGSDSFIFYGSNVGEVCTLAANDSRVLFTHNVGTVSVDLNGIETFDLKFAGSNDTLIVNDLAGTGVATVIADLAGLSGVTGDGMLDNIIIKGTAAADVISLTAAGSDVTVTGLAATVKILKPEKLNDDVLIQGFGGEDHFSVSPAVHNLIRVTTEQ